MLQEAELPGLFTAFNSQLSLTAISALRSSELLHETSRWPQSLKELQHLPILYAKNGPVPKPTEKTCLPDAPTDRQCEHTDSCLLLSCNVSRSGVCCIR